MLKDLDFKWEFSDCSGKWFKFKFDYVYFEFDFDVLIIGEYMVIFYCFLYVFVGILEVY